MTQGRGVEGAEAEWAPPGIDTSTPHSARMYDWWLGGKDNFAADRAMGQLFIEAIPSIRTMARENRQFMHRAARYLTAEAGHTLDPDIVGALVSLACAAEPA